MDRKKRVARILIFKIWPSQEILKIRDGTPLEAEKILTYRKKPRNGSVWHFYSKLDVPSNVLQKERVARILVFKIRPSQEILKIRDGTHLEAEEILTYRKSPEMDRVARILVFKIWPSQEILKIRDGTPLEAEEILTYRKNPRNGSVWHFSSKLDVPSYVLQNKRVAQILVFKIRPSQEILKIRDGTPLEAEEILTYIKRPRNGSVWYFSSKLDVPSNVLQKKRVARDSIFQNMKKAPKWIGLALSSKLDVPSNVLQKKRVARILVFKIRPSQEINKIRDGTLLEAEEILTYRKKPRNGSVWHFSSKLDVPSNVLQKKRVAQILVFKIRPSQEILKIRDGTPSELDVPSNVLQKKRVAQILVFKIRPSQEILKIRDDVPSKVLQKKRVAWITVFKIRPSQEINKIRDGTLLEADEILTYRKKPRNGSVWHISSKLDVPSNVLQKKRVARILVFKIRPSQEINKIRDGTLLEAEEILTYRKKPRNGSVWHFSSKLDVPSNVLQKKRVAQILVFKIRPSQEILKIRNEINKIRDGTPLEAEEILTYRKKPRNGPVWHFSSKLDVPSNVLQKKRVAQILVFKIRPSQEILKIHDGTLRRNFDIQKKAPKWIGLALSSKLDVPSNVLQKKRVARILVFKIRPSQEINKIRDGTLLEAEEILTYRKKPRNGSVWHFSSKLDVPSNVLQKKRVAQILVFKIRPSQEILKIRDGTPSECKVLQKKRVAWITVFKIRPSQEINKIRDGTLLEADEILTYRKKPRNGSVWHISSKLDVPSNVLQKKRVARILVFKIRPSQEINKIRDGTLLEAEEILTYRKKPRNGSVWHFSSKLDVPSNVLQKKRVAQILVFKIRPSQEILKIRNEINKIRDGTPLEAEEILTYRKKPRNGPVWHFSSKLDVPSNVLQKKRVAQILVFKIRPSQEILKIHDGTLRRNFDIQKKAPKWIGLALSSKLDVPSNVLQKKRVARILVFKIRPSQEINKIRDGTLLEAEEILTYRKKPRNGSVWHFSSKLDVPSNVLQKKRVAQILVFKIRPSQEILKIRDGTPSEKKRKKRVAQILVFKIRPSQEILKIRDDVPSKVLQKKRVAWITVFKIRPSQEINKIRDGTLLEAEEILTYRKKPRNGSVWHISSKLDVPSNVLQKKRVARILVFKIRPSQEIKKIRDGNLLEAEEILTYRKKPRNGSVWHISSKLDVPSNVLQKKRVARILVFKIRPSQEINKIRDGTLLEAEEILTYRKKPRNGSVWHFSSKLDVPSNVLQKKRVAQILVFKIRPSQEILKIRNGTPSEKRMARIMVFKIRPSQEINKIRDGTPLEAEEILTYRKSPEMDRVAQILVFKIRPSQEILKIHDGTPSEKKRVAQIPVLKIKPSQEILIIRDVARIMKKRVARILVFKIRPSQEINKIRDDTLLEAEEILTYRKEPSQEINKIRDGTLLEAEEILTYRKKPRNGSVWHFSSKLDVPSNVLQKKRVAQILVFKIKPSQEINQIRDGTLLEAEEILTYRKKPRNGSVWHFSSKLDVPSNVLQKKRVAQILVFKIRPSQEILKIRNGTPSEAEEILTYRKKPSKWKRMARIMVFKIRPSQEINKIRDGTPLEAEEILTYRKKPRNGSVWHFSSKLYVPSNVLQKKRVAQILVFKIRPSQEILKIHDGTPSEAEEILTYRKKPSKWMARIMVFKIRPSQEINKIGDVARILVFKIRPSQEINKIRDDTLLEAEEILTYRKGHLKKFSKFMMEPFGVKKRLARIMVFKIRPSQEINKIRDGTLLEAEEILTYRKKPRNGSVWHFSSNLDVPSNVLQKKRVARIMVFKIRPSQEINKIRDGTLLEAEKILTYRKKPRDGSKRVAQILVFKIRPSQEILKKKRVAQILVFKIRPSQEINKIRYGTHLEAEEILTYRKKPRNGSVWHFSSKLDVPSNVLQKKRVAQILVFKISKFDVPSNVLQKKRMARIMVFKIRPSQEINKIRDGTPLEAEEILTYRKKPRNGPVWHFSSKLDVPSNVLQKKRVAQILVFKIRPSQEILKIHDGTLRRRKENFDIQKKAPKWIGLALSSKLDVPSNVLQKKRVARILVFKIRPSQEINKIRDGTLLEAEEILTYRKKPRNGSVWHFSSKLDVPSNVLQKKRVAQILVFKIRPSQEILKIRDGTPSEKKRKKPKWIGLALSSKLDVPSNVLQKKRVAQILVFKIRPSQEILKIRDDKLDVPSKVLQKKRVAWITVFKIRPSQEINKIRDGTLLEAEEILTYRKKPRNGSVWHISSKLDVPSNVLQKKRVARILVFKIRPSQEIKKIRDGNLLEAEEILTYRKKPRNGSVWHISSKLDVPSNVLQKKRVARILVFKIRPSQEINKIRDGTLLEAEEILTYRKKPRNGSVWHFSSKLDVPSNVLQKKRVAQILVFKIRPSQEILKIRNGTPSEAEEILTYRKKP
ncbi:hypothetical protein OROMI_013027 [Orobanche minor]